MGRKKLTTKEIKERIYSLEGDNYKLLSEYVNARTKIKVKHVACGTSYEVRWTNFQQGQRCPKCAGNYRYTDNEINKLVSEMTDGEYTKLSEYKNSYTKFKIRHTKCNCVYETVWGNFQAGARCPKCAGLMKLTNEEIVQKIYELVGDEYTKLDDTYINAHTKFRIKHSLCGHEFEVNWNNFQGGNRCPFCNQSKGEKFISDYLTNQGISFTAQIRFSDCKYKNTLPFDFAILDSEMRVKALIEYDGKQHFEPVEYWGGEENLKVIQIRDAVKNEYCAKNKIPLLRIRFDEDIEEKLNLFINQEAERKV